METKIELNNKEIINGWAFFDWANSAFALVIAVAIFPPYYTSITNDTITIFSYSFNNSTIYAWALSAAYLIIGIASPLLSSLADIVGKRKFFLKIFTYIGGFSCISLATFHSAELWWVGILLFMGSIIGFAGGLVFYNSYLPIIVSKDKMNYASSKGFAYGYVGSVILLIICLLCIQFAPNIGIENGTIPIRFSFVLVGVWWIIFGNIAFKRLPDDIPMPFSAVNISHGYNVLHNVWKKAGQSKTLIRFLIAFFFYSTGVQTILYMATPFAENEIEFLTSELIILILILQIVAIGGAYLFSWISELRGNKVSIIAMLIIWVIICIVGSQIEGKTDFYILASILGLVMGGIQSISRSTYAQFVQHERESITTFFSLYDILEKAAIIIGAFLFGYIDQITGSMRNSLIMLGIFFIIALIFISITPFVSKKIEE